MRRLKRVLILSMVSIMTVSMVGCKDKDKDKETTKQSETTTEVAKKPQAEDQKPLGNLSYDLVVDADTKQLDESADISEILYGLFLEDINHAVDGGMYAELIKNRSFEYDELALNQNKHGWALKGAASNKDVIFDVADGSTDGTCLNKNNPHYAKMNNAKDAESGIGNSGYLDGLAIEKGDVYKFSVFLKSESNYAGPVNITIEDGSGVVYATGKIDKITSQWNKYELELTANETLNGGLKLYILTGKGSIEIDSVSLFPKDTYKGRENGIRKDIGEYLENLNGKFLRFPGGCIVEGKTIESQYSWKDSIGDGLEFEINGKTTVGDVAARPQGLNLWHSSTTNPYYTTYGLGFYEYFLLCEDLECLPVPIVNAGMLCPIQSPNYQVVGTRTEEFKQYIQDALDLVEFCRGDSTTKWGKVRIDMGHKEPFELKYVGIGNEQWQEEYYAHYALFLEAFQEAAKENPEMYGDIELIVANGPASGDQFGWNKVKANGGTEYAGLVDEHYYQTPDWFLNNVNRYDSYDRNSTPVFLGEYAAKANTMQAALAEAAYLTGIEDNADIVKMACYAPLFGSDKESQWSPDMIWFSNNKVYGSVNYYVQKMFGSNVGKKILNTQFTQQADEGETGLSGKVGLGSWQTSAKFDDLKVVSNETGEELYSTDFSEGDIKGWQIQGGTFAVKDGALEQSNTSSPKNNNTGDVAYFGEESWSNYTLTVKATKLSGDEGFLIPIAVTDKDNNLFWNIGGWGNTVSCLQQVQGGVKGDQIEGTVSDVKLVTGTEYELKIVLDGNTVKCYIDGKEVVNKQLAQSESVFQTTSVDENGDIIIKIVNVSERNADMNVKVTNAEKLAAKATLTVLASESIVAKNTKTKPDLITDKESQIDVSADFKYQAPKYSVSIIRIQNK